MIPGQDFSIIAAMSVTKSPGPTRVPGVPSIFGAGPWAGMALVEVLEQFPAAGENPNPFYFIAPTAKPLLSPKDSLSVIAIKPAFLYDRPTEAGRIYKR